jgi:hypothetical protein
MAIPGNILDREFEKFVEAGLNETAVRVVVAGGSFSTQDYSDQALNLFDESLAVPGSTLSTIVSYVVPVGKKLLLSRVESSGENIATYSVLVDAATIAKQRTYFGSALNVEFNFYAPSSIGYKISSGQTVQVKVIHSRPTTADFEARIFGVLLDE